MRQDRKKITAKCEIDDSFVTLETALPVVITVKKGSNNRRMPSIENIKRAFLKEIEVVGAVKTDCDFEKLGLNGSPTRVVKIEPAVTQGNCEIYDEKDYSKGIDKILKKWHERLL